jgi:hypothetical protein
MRRSDHALYFHLAFEDFRTKFHEGDRALIEIFTLLLDALDKQGIQLEVIDDA